MATTVIIELIAQLSINLHDRNNIRWPRPELLTYFNSAQKAICRHKPDSYVVNEEFACEAEETRQVLPDGGIRLIEVVRNVAEDSQHEAISIISRDVMDTTVPDWHRSDPAINIENYVFDERDPKHFYLYPPPSTDAEIEIIYSKSPDDIVITDYDTDEQTITLDDVYAEVIMDYMAYRAHAKDSDYANNRRSSTGHYNDFANALGIKARVDIESSPNIQ
jgi:hypothetical protein